MPLMDEISVQKLNWRQWSELAPTWERIHNMCPDASFFLSREWVDCWLATFGEDLNPDLLTFARDGDVVGCCLLVWRTQWVRGVPLRRVYLNCAGENEADSTCIEYNSLLSLPESAQLVLRAFVSFLRTRYWDELLLQGMLANRDACSAVRSLGSVEISERASHYVDLCKLRRDAVDFDSALSAKARKNIRRSHRTYDQIGGTCTVRVAGGSDEALAMLRDLATLHQASWADRGRRGVFGSPQFVSFHEALIRRGFGDGHILLFHVRTGPELIGVLYCFLDHGWVRFYQSGFNYSLDAHMSPGLVTLYLAIRHCLDHQEFMAFDFLAGDSQYKRSLATASRPLQWIVVRRSTVPSFLFRGLRWVKRTYVQILKKSYRKTQPSCGVERSADVSLPNIEAGSVVSNRSK
jgi:hypothetical protein